MEKRCTTEEIEKFFWKNLMTILTTASQQILMKMRSHIWNDTTTESNLYELPQ